MQFVTPHYIVWAYHFCMPLQFYLYLQIGVPLHSFECLPALLSHGVFKLPPCLPVGFPSQLGLVYSRPLFKNLLVDDTSRRNHQLFRHGLCCKYFTFNIIRTTEKRHLRVNYVALWHLGWRINSAVTQLNSWGL